MGAKGTLKRLKSSPLKTTEASAPYKRLDRPYRAIALVLGLVTLIGVGTLFAWDANPKFFPAGAHDFLAAFPLVIVAVAYLLYQSARRPGIKKFFKAISLAIAFLFWAATQLWPSLPQATLFNDIAIALFVLDVFLVITGWPETSPDESLAETYVEDHDSEKGSVIKS